MNGATLMGLTAPKCYRAEERKETVESKPAAWLKGLSPLSFLSTWQQNHAENEYQ